MGYVRMTMGKLKNSHAMSMAYKHNTRLLNCDNADKNRSHENIDLIKRDLDYDNYFDKRISEIVARKGKNGISVRKNSVHGIEICIGISEKDYENNPLFDVNEFCRLSKEWICDNFGEENVAGMTLHMDEITPHVHAVIIPITKDERLSSREIFGSREHLQELQTSIADKLAPLGLKRGLKRSVAKHHDIRRFYEAVNQTDIEMLPEVKENEDAIHYRMRANAVFSTERKQQLGTVEDLKREIVELKTNLRQLRGENINQPTETEELKRENQHLRSVLRQYETAIEQWENIVYAIQNNLLSGNEKNDLLRLMNTAKGRAERDKAEKNKANEVQK